MLLPSKDIIVGEGENENKLADFEGCFSLSVWLVSKGTDGEDDELQVHSCCYGSA
jgi:hypothetical protein